MNITRNIYTSKNKTLKLTNAVLYPFFYEANEVEDSVELLQNYIRNKGNKAIGPVIQCTEKVVDTNGDNDIEMYLIMQTESPIHKVESPFIFKNQIKIRNCLYSHFVGAEKDIKYAHDKLLVEAYESGKNLTGRIYVIYIDKSDEDKVVVDIFVECNETT